MGQGIGPRMLQDLPLNNLAVAQEQGVLVIANVIYWFPLM